MEVTLDYIQRKFDEFNALCFEGKLQPLPFRLSRARRFLGQVRCSKRRRWNGKWHYYDFEFVVSQRSAIADVDVDDVILHEMIHYYILSNQMQDTSAHGAIFRSVMQDINKRFNRHITVGHRATPQEQDRDTEVREHVICVTRLADGSVGVTAAAHTRIYQLWRQMQRIPGVASQTWYVSIDPYFNRLPRSLTPKAYHLPEAELERHIANARRIVMQGGKLVYARE